LLSVMNVASIGRICLNNQEIYQNVLFNQLIAYKKTKDFLKIFCLDRMQMTI
jgi:hypothetical protein